MSVALGIVGFGISIIVKRTMTNQIAMTKKQSRNASTIACAATSCPIAPNACVKAVSGGMPVASIASACRA